MGNKDVSLFAYIFMDVLKVFLRSLIFGLSLAKPRVGTKSVSEFVLKERNSRILLHKKTYDKFGC